MGPREDTLSLRQTKSNILMLTCIGQINIPSSMSLSSLSIQMSIPMSIIPTYQ